MKRIFILLLFLLCCSPTYAIELEYEKVSNYTSSRNADSQLVQRLYVDDNTIINVSYLLGSLEAYIDITDLNNTNVRTVNSTITSGKTYNGILKLRDGGYLLYGNVIGSKATYNYGVITKIDKNFNLVWTNTTEISEGNYIYSFNNPIEDSVGNIYLCALPNQSVDGSICLVKYSSAGVFQWATYLYSSTDGFSSSRTLCINSSGNVEISYRVGVNTYNLYTKILNSSTGKFISSALQTLSTTLDKFYFSNEEYIIFTPGSLSYELTGNIYKFIKGSGQTILLYDFPSSAVYVDKMPLIQLPNGDYIIIVYNSGLYISVYDSSFNYKSSGYVPAEMSDLSNNLTGFITNNEYLYFSNLYNSGSTAPHYNSFFTFLLKRPLPIINTFSALYTNIGDNTLGQVIIGYDLKENTNYTMKIYNMNSPNTIYYQGVPIYSLQLDLAEGNNYLQTSLSNNVNTIISNIVAINKRNLLEKTLDSLNLENGLQKLIIIDDIDRYFENNTINQTLISRIKTKSSGTYLIYNDLSPVLVPLLE